MLSATTATELLQRCDSVARLGKLAVTLGFAARSEPLAAELRRQLGLGGAVAHARIACGSGALRALIVELSRGVVPREALTELAQSLSRRAPHCLWLIVGRAAGNGTVFLAAWMQSNPQPPLRILLVNRDHVFASDAETLCALAATRDGPDVLIHGRWLEILGRDALTRRFHTRLAEVVQRLAEDLSGSATATVRRELALLNVSRLMFLAFIQTKGWLNGDHFFLQNTFDSRIASGGQVHRSVLEPLFFGTLNTRRRDRERRARSFGDVPYLNGGLFARAYAERVHRSARFSDAALGTVFGDLLSRYRFTPREESTDWSESAIDPEILGRAFESLMEQEARRATGVFYTPLEVVSRATDLALRRALTSATAAENAVAAALAGERPDDHANLLHAVRRLRLLDPACGSGAFLVHALRVLADLRVLLGDETRSAARAAVLARSIYGVDINPTAVWLCQLRLWLCLAVESDATCGGDVPPLPNLDRNIRVGDSLAVATAADSPRTRRVAAQAEKLRARYVRAQGQRKRTLAGALDRAERQAAVAHLDARIESVALQRREIIVAVRSRDLFGERRAAQLIAAEMQRLRRESRALRAERTRLLQGAALPFSFHVHFADVAGGGGFDVVVGNPPWVRPHKLAPATRRQLRSAFAVARVPPGSGPFPRRAFGGQVDLAAPFVERSLTLLRPGGAVALLLPAKLWSSVAGGALRHHIASSARLVAIEDFTGAEAMFAAVTYPSLLVLEKPAGDDDSSPPTSVVIHRRGGMVQWTTDPRGLCCSSDPLSPWLLLPRNVRRAFDRVCEAGAPLATTHFGIPRLGVKTGCNAAFVVTVDGSGRDLTEICSGEHRGWIERQLLRPVLRGELVRAWRASGHSRERIVWTHDAFDRPLRQLPPHASRWFGQWRRELGRRSDGRPGGARWQLFRTPSARSDRHRVVWSDFGRTPRALVLEPGDPTVPINTCYVVFADAADAWALAALLNSPLAAAWLNAASEPARGGYRRYFSWTIGTLPLPADIGSLQRELAPLGRRAADGSEPTPAELLDAALAAYGVRHRDVAPLLEWLDV